MRLNVSEADSVTESDAVPLKEPLGEPESLSVAVTLVVTERVRVVDLVVLGDTDGLRVVEPDRLPLPLLDAVTVADSLPVVDGVSVVVDESVTVTLTVDETVGVTVVVTLRVRDDDADNVIDRVDERVAVELSDADAVSLAGALKDSELLSLPVVEGDGE